MSETLLGDLIRSSTIETATKFVVRTVLHKVVTKDLSGNPKDRTQVFIQVGSYCSQSEWEQALKYEKEFEAINKEYRTRLDKVNGTWKMKDPGNPLKTSPISIR